jgi:hypothetical protein
MTREQEPQRSRRLWLSLLSLLLLFLLLTAWVSFKAMNETTGRFISITTAEVRLGVVTEATATPSATPSGPTAVAATPTPGPAVGVPTVARPVIGAQPGITAEVLGAADEPSLQPTPLATPSATQPVTDVQPGTGPTEVPGVPTAPPGGNGSAPTLPTDPGQPGAPGATPTAPSGPGGGGPGSGGGGGLAIEGFAAPGAYKNHAIRVTNPGTIAFHYSLGMQTSGDAPFAQVLRLRVFLRVGSSCDFLPPPASGGDFLPLSGDQVGTVLYDGNFATGLKFGNPSIEIAPGDRQLGPGQAEVLCMEVFFPWDAGNDFQGQSVNGTFVFTAKSPSN